MSKAKESTAIVPQQQPITITPQGWNAVRNLAEAIQVAEIVGKSAALPDVRNSGVALMKILAGGEMGFGPFASLVDVHIIEGKPSVGAHLKAAAIKRSGKYDYKIHRCDREACDLEFFESTSGKWESLGHVTMTYQEADEAGLTRGREGVKRNWKVSPDDMLFARCVSKGYRRHCPELTGGVLAYDPDELDGINDPIPTTGMVEALPVVVSSTTAQVIDAEPTEPVDLPELPPVGQLSSQATAQQIARMHELFTALKLTDAQVASALKKRGVNTIEELTVAQAGEVIETLEAKAKPKG